MGEVIFALFVGGWMIFLGLIINVCSKKEEQKYRNESKLNNDKNRTLNT